MALGLGLALGLGALGLGAGYLGGQAQGAGIDKAMGLTRKQMALYTPWREAGMEALGRLRNFEFDPNDPSYQWRLGEGEKGIDQFLASRGLHGSRAGLNALTDFRSRLGAEEYGSQYGRAFNLAEMGLGATRGMSGAGAGLPGMAMAEGQNKGAFWSGLPGMAGSAMMGGYYGGQLFGGGGAGGGGLPSASGTGSGLPWYSSGGR